MGAAASKINKQNFCIRHNRTFTVILAKHCIKLPDGGSLVIRNMLEHF